VTSERQRTANRANALRSTGPRTAAGKVAASGNARRHGLAAKRKMEKALTEQIEGLAHALAGDGAGPARLFHARIAAEATLELCAIRKLGAHLIEATSESDTVGRDGSAQSRRPHGTDSLRSGSAFAGASPELETFERYERRAWSRRKMALRRMEDLS
jgi:hypothetical protein